MPFWGVGYVFRCSRMACLRNATWLDYLSLGAAIIFVEACFVVFTSTLAASAQEFADSIHGNITQSGDTNNPQSDGTEITSNGHTSGNWLFNKSLQRNLPPNSNHKPSNKPEVFVELETRADATRVLNSSFRLRSFTMSRFNGSTWSASRLEQAPLKSPITFPRKDHSRVTSKPIKHTVYHAASQTGQNLFTAFQGTIQTDIKSLTPVSDSIYLLPSLKDATTGYTYTATSRPVSLTELIGKDPQVAEAPPAYLTIPDNLAPRIRKIAELFSDQSTLTQ